MMIKDVKVTDFMTFKNVVILSDLDPGHNIIGGRNGSGKSTFLRAIRFVLTNDFPCTTSKEKLTILNDSKKFARVDIIIDNSDYRFPTDNETLRFSRQIDLKKDLYFIGNKRNEKSDFFKFLQLANFSIKQPIYIIPQGETRRLAVISNEERLRILEDVSGFREFKEQEKFTNQCKTQQNTKLDIITAALDNFEGKLNYLKDDINELQEFDLLKKQVDTIKIIISKRQLAKIEKDLKHWQDKETEYQEKRNNLKNEFRKMEEKERELLNSLNNLENLLEKLEKKKKEHM